MFCKYLCLIYFVAVRKRKFCIAAREHKRACFRVCLRVATQGIAWRRRRHLQAAGIPANAWALLSMAENSPEADLFLARLNYTLHN